MLFKDSKPISLTNSGSPSLVNGNLTYCPKLDYLCYTRLNEVFLVHTNGESHKVPVSKSKIFQASYILLQSGVYIICVVSNLGLQIWNATGDTMLYFYPLHAVPMGDDEHAFMRGVATGVNFISVGCSMGSVVVFSVSSDCKQFSLLHTLDTDNNNSNSGTPISALSTTNSLLVAGNDNGQLFGYKSDTAFEHAFTLPGQTFPCTALVQPTENTLVAGYASGHIRIFRTDIVELCVEITAHTRSVSGFSLFPANNWLATCSIDQIVQVWQLPDFHSLASSQVELLYSKCFENKICTGIAFLGRDRLSVASYDEDELILLEMD
eukprot:gene6472-8902_t